jgi:nucleoside-diphosphate-sugar epimerase
MKGLVTGATGYRGAVVAEALATRGHQGWGLARSERSANELCACGIEPVRGDFGDPVGLANAVHQARSGVVVRIACVGGVSGHQGAFTGGGAVVHAKRAGLVDHGRVLICRRRREVA